MDYHFDNWPYLSSIYRPRRLLQLWAACAKWMCRYMFRPSQKFHFSAYQTVCLHQIAGHSQLHSTHLTIMSSFYFDLRVLFTIISNCATSMSLQFLYTTNTEGYVNPYRETVIRLTHGSVEMQIGRFVV